MVRVVVERVAQVDFDVVGARVGFVFVAGDASVEVVSVAAVGDVAFPRNDGSVLHGGGDVDFAVRSRFLFAPRGDYNKKKKQYHLISLYLYIYLVR